MPPLTLRQYLAIAKLVALLVLIAWALRLNDLRGRWHHMYEAEHAARMADRSIYEGAQKQAQEQNRAQVQKIETQQQRITTDVETDYQRKLDAMRRELRSAPSKAAPGPAGGSSSPQTGNPTKVPDGSSGVPLSDVERLRAAENELQLDELITWVEQQSKIDPNQ